MKFCIVHYNTPELTACLCSSIKKQHDNPEIIIFDNSDKRPFKEMAELFGCTYFDNTKGQLINFNAEIVKHKRRMSYDQKRSGCNFGSVKHSMSIQYLIDNLDESFILLDSDILLKKPIDFIDENFACVSDIIIVNKRTRFSRISPMLAYINVPLIKKHKIRFFDANRMHSLDVRHFDYDTGASFLEDIKKIKSFKHLNTSSYFVHYGHGSWQNNFYKGWLVKHLRLWQ